MALIGKIREKSWLLLIVVGGAIVVFIFTSGGPNFGGGVEEEYGVGLMYGEKMDRDGYNTKVNEANKIAEMNARNSGQPPQPVNEDAVWNQFVEEALLEQEFDALGIHVSEEEFDAFLYARNGFDPLPDLANTFKDAAGNFDAKALETQINQLTGPEATKEMKQAWEQSKDYYYGLRKRQKYFDIISQGMYVTNLEAKQEYLANEEKKSVKFVAMNYSTIDESTIKKTESKLRAFYKKHKNEAKYINRRSERVVRWADIRVVPSAKDSSDFNKLVNDLKAGLESATNDSIYVSNNAGTGADRLPFVSRVGFRPEGSENSLAKQGFTYPRNMDTTFAKAQVGDVIGPYDQNGGKRIAKVIGKAPLYSVRHILIGAQREDTVAVEKAQVTVDSLMPLINADNFEDYVTEFSADQPSVAKGGKYENFIGGEMVPEFEEFAKTKAVGTIDYVQTQFGFHIIEVLDRQEDAVPSLAVIQRTLIPSTATINDAETSAYDLLDNMYTKMDKVSDSYKKVVKFDTLAKRADMVVRTMTIQENSPKINGFTSEFAENEIFRLAFQEGANVGDLISSPVKDGERWVVAVLADIKVKGESTFENAYRTVETEYMKEERFKKLRAKMSGKSLQQLESGESTFAQSAEVVMGRSNMGPSAREPKVVGAVFSGLADGKMTQPLKGTAGVYVVKIEKSVKAPENVDFTTQRDQLLATRRGQVQSAALSALKDMAEIVDNRRFSSIRVRN